MKNILQFKLQKLIILNQIYHFKHERAGTRFFLYLKSSLSSIDQSSDATCHHLTSSNLHNSTTCHFFTGSKFKRDPPPNSAVFLKFFGESPCRSSEFLQLFRWRLGDPKFWRPFGEVLQCHIITTSLCHVSGRQLSMVNQ